jgi:hypothetical protein
LAVEQRWFIGAHANVGGGYGKDPLADIAFQWMLEHALEAGLKLDSFEANEDAWKTDPRPSFDEFLGGVYAFFRRLKAKGDGKHHRKYAHDRNGREAVNVSVDESVWRRWKESSGNYRPKTLTQAGQEPPP